jgi:ABC-2 type transport system ATP-binding protein
MENIIETKNLTKKFGNFTSVNNVSLTVRKGEIYGFLGLNGAGKTTTIRMLLGMIRPTSGAAFLKGKKVSASCQDLWNSVGYLVEIPYPYPDLTVRENLEMARRLRCMSNPKAVDIVMGKLKIDRYSDRPAKNLSLGNAQRLGLAKALIHGPEVLILDEPANGLDPAGIVEVRELLNNLAQERGVTVFISSHILDEVSRFATRIGIIHEGRLLQEVDSRQLEIARKKRLVVRVKDNTAVQDVLVHKGYRAAPVEDGMLEVSGENAINDAEKVNAILVHAGHTPSMINVCEEALESYFLRAIGSQGGAL